MILQCSPKTTNSFDKHLSFDLMWYYSIVDTTPPTVNSCPTDVLINVELGETEGEATWTEPSSTDLSGTDQLVSRSRAPGTPFPLGDTTVTYLYTDDSGNTATCVFCVTVGTGKYPMMVVKVK